MSQAGGSIVTVYGRDIGVTLSDQDSLRLQSRVPTLHERYIGSYVTITSKQHATSMHMGATPALHARLDGGYTEGSCRFEFTLVQDSR